MLEQQAGQMYRIRLYGAATPISIQQGVVHFNYRTALILTKNPYKSLSIYIPTTKPRSKLCFEEYLH